MNLKSLYNILTHEHYHCFIDGLPITNVDFYTYGGDRIVINYNDWGVFVITEVSGINQSGTISVLGANEAASISVHAALDFHTVKQLFEEL